MVDGWIGLDHPKLVIFNPSEKHISWSPKNLPAFLFKLLSGGGINAVEKKHALQIGSSPQLWVKIKKIWNRDFVPKKAIGWSFPQVDVNIQDVWNHHDEITLPLVNPLYTPHSEAKILCPHVTGKRTCPNPADRGELQELQFLTICLFWGTHHSQSFSICTATHKPFSQVLEKIVLHTKLHIFLVSFDSSKPYWIPLGFTGNPPDEKPLRLRFGPKVLYPWSTSRVPWRLLDPDCPDSCHRCSQYWSSPTRQPFQPLSKPRGSQFGGKESW